jgi:phage terminase Nu1 subunit (DNA packaging protein)
VRDKTTDDIAELFDVDESTIKRWVAQGLPCDKGGRGQHRRFDEGEVAAWLKSKNLTGKPGRPQTEGGRELLAAKVRKENALATRYEIEVAERRGELLNRSEVERQNVQKVAALRNGLLSLSATLAPSLEGRSAEDIQGEIERAIVRILEHYARGLAT